MEERENYDFFSSRSNIFFVILYFCCSTRFAGMDRSEWMYRMKRMEPQYLVHVQKSVAAVKAHRERLDRTTTICPCSHCKNMKAHKDSEVQSHLIRFGFVKDYTVWTFHCEKVVDATVGMHLEGTRRCQ
jgi:hypothetical protein